MLDGKRSENADFRLVYFKRKNK